MDGSGLLGAACTSRVCGGRRDHARGEPEATWAGLSTDDIDRMNAADALLASVQSGDRVATVRQLVRTEHDGCGACHRQHGYE